MSYIGFRLRRESNEDAVSRLLVQQNVFVVEAGRGRPSIHREHVHCRLSVMVK